MDNPAFKEDEFRSFIVFMISTIVYQRCCDFVANGNENQKKMYFCPELKDV